MALTGTGTNADPYIIQSVADFDDIRLDVTAVYSVTPGEYDFGPATSDGGIYWNAGAGWVPIGSGAEASFSGELRGNGAVIRNLFISRSTFGERGGFFAFLAGGTIRDLKMVDPNITANGDTGSISGRIDNGGLISGCSVVGGTLTCNRDQLGGIVGNFDAGIIRNCYSETTLVGGDPGVTQYIGGIASLLDSTTSFMYKCIGNSTASSTNSGTTNIGGCTAQSFATVENCFYNTDKIATAGGGNARGTGKTAAELQAIATYNDVATTGLDEVYGITTLGSHSKVTGQATGGTLSTLETGLTLTLNELLGYTIKITGGTGAGQVRTIESNTTGGQIVPRTDFAIAPDATSTYEYQPTWAIDTASFPILYYEIAGLSGTITDEQAAVVDGATVDVYRLPSSLGTKTFVESVQSNAQGVWKMTEAYVNTNGYIGDVRYHKVADSGTADSGTDTTLTDAKAWTENEFNEGYILKITAGTNSGEERTIVSNTADTITVDRAFTAAIDATSVYEIVQLKYGITKYYPPQA